MRKSKRSGFLAAVIAVIGALLLSPAAEAHRIGIPITTLEWDEPSGAWHLVHQLSVHDFAHEIGGLDTGRLEDPEVQTAVGQYVIQYFSIVGQTDTIEISYIGAEEDADSFFVYFQLSSPDQAVQIDNDLANAGGADERRHALVNIETGDEISTLLFAINDGPKTAELKRPSD